MRQAEEEQVAALEFVGSAVAEIGVAAKIRVREVNEGAREAAAM